MVRQFLVNGNFQTRVIGIAIALVAVALVVWILQWEDPVPREPLAELPCQSMEWTIDESPVSGTEVLTVAPATSVLIKGRMTADPDWKWSQLSHAAVGRDRSPPVLPSDVKKQLLKRRGPPPTTEPGTTRVIRMWIICLPQAGLTPSELAILPMNRVSVSLDVKGEIAYFGADVELPEVPGEYWLQLLCEFTTDETYNEFEMQPYPPIAEVAVRVLANSP